MIQIDGDNEISAPSTDVFSSHNTLPPAPVCCLYYYCACLIQLAQASVAVLRGGFKIIIITKLYTSKYDYFF